MNNKVTIEPIDLPPLIRQVLDRLEANMVSMKVFAYEVRLLEEYIGSLKSTVKAISPEDYKLEFLENDPVKEQSHTFFSKIKLKKKCVDFHHTPFLP